MFACNKHSSLFLRNVINEDKKFRNTDGGNLYY